MLGFSTPTVPNGPTGQRDPEAPNRSNSPNGPSQLASIIFLLTVVAWLDLYLIGVYASYVLDNRLLKDVEIQ